MKAQLVLEDGTIFQGQARGYKKSTSGEVVFATGMVGYDLSLTDPSYRGQILTFTYPLIGNWGVPNERDWESNKIQVQAVIVSELCEKPSHYAQEQTLENWLIKSHIPAIADVDTRALTQKLRQKGVMLGKIIVNNEDIGLQDPNEKNLVAAASVEKVILHRPTLSKKINIALLNCGAKRNIITSLTKRGATVIELPWNYNPFENNIKFDGLVISNGPGDPKMAKESISIIQKALSKKIPTFGICLGNQLLALAAGGDTFKLKFGHRAQNQPTVERGTKRCYITTQNHGYAVDEKKLPDGFKTWFYNANDGTNEGMIHDKLPFMSVQFHPEAMPGPTDTEFLFDKYLNLFK